MEANNLSLTLPPIVVGQTYIKSVYWETSCGVPIMLPGYTAKMQFRVTVLSNGSPVIDLSTENGTIIIDEDNGIVTITIPSNVTAALTPYVNLYYDLFVYSSTGIPTPLIAGTVQILGSTIQ